MSIIFKILGGFLIFLVIVVIVQEAKTPKADGPEMVHLFYLSMVGIGFWALGYMGEAVELFERWVEKVEDDD